MNKYTLKLLIASLIFTVTIMVVTQLFTNIYKENYIPPDSYTYIESSKMCYLNQTLHPTRPIGYALLLGIPYLFSSEASNEIIVTHSMVINFMFWLLTIFVFFKCLNLFLNQRISFYTSFVIVFCISSIGSIGLIMPETVFNFFLSLACYLVFRYHKKKNNQDLFWSITVFTISVFIRPGIFYWALLLNIGFIAFLLWNRKAFNVKYSLPWILSVVFLLTQMTGMNAKYGNFTTSYIDKITWYLYLGSDSYSKYNGVSFLETKIDRHKTLKGLSWNKKHQISSEDLKFQVSNHPNIVIGEYGKNLIHNSIGRCHGIHHAKNLINTGFHERIKHYLEQISSLQNILSIFTAFVLCIYLGFNIRLINIPLFICMGSILYIFLTSGVSDNQGDRFHMVFYPVVFMVLIYILSEKSLIKKDFIHD